MRWLRRSRKWYNVVAIFLLTVSALSLGTLLLDSFAFKSEPPSRIPDQRSVVSVGLRNPEAFAGYKGANRPYFNFCPSANGAWRVRFNWQVLVSSNPEGFLRTSPTVDISIPSDASEITAEKGLDFDPKEDTVEQGGPALTSVEESKTPAGDRMLSLRPIMIAPPTNGNKSQFAAYFGVHFRTTSLDRGMDGLSKRHFKISLGPRPPGSSPIEPDSIPENSPSGTIAFISCSSDDGRHIGKGERAADLDNESLFPAPGGVLERGKLVWATNDSAQFAVTGTVSGGGWLSTLTEKAGWFAVNSFSAAMGAIYGAGISPKPSDSSVQVLQPRAPRAPDSSPKEQREGKLTRSKGAQRNPNRGKGQGQRKGRRNR